MQELQEQHQSLQYIHGIELDGVGLAILRRNRGLQAVRDIRSCQGDTLDLSGKDFGYEGAKVVAAELEVWFYAAAALLYCNFYHREYELSCYVNCDR